MLTCNKTAQVSRRVVTICPISDFSVEVGEFLYVECISWFLQRQLLLQWDYSSAKGAGML